MSSKSPCTFPFETKWSQKNYYEMLEICRSWLCKGKVLDIGCGRGESTHFLGATGFEIRKFSAWKQLDATFLVANGIRLPFKDSCFDGVLVNNVLEHIADKKTLISEIKRVAKSDCNYVFIVPTPKWKIYKFIDLPKNFSRILRGYEPIDWWVHEPNVHGLNWFSEFNDFRNWDKFMSKHFVVERKVVKRNGFQFLFKCSNR